jgi:hypothetical protein
VLDILNLDRCLLTSVSLPDLMLAAQTCNGGGQWGMCFFGRRHARSRPSGPPCPRRSRVAGDRRGPWLPYLAWRTVKGCGGATGRAGRWLGPDQSGATDPPPLRARCAFRPVSTRPKQPTPHRPEHTGSLTHAAARTPAWTHGVCVLGNSVSSRHPPPPVSVHTTILARAKEASHENE